MGPIEQKIAKQAMRERQPLPDRIANAPTLLMGSQFYLDAFFDLDSERSHGIAPTAIPRSSIVAYATEYGLENEEKDDLIYLIRCMDNDRLKAMRKDGKESP